MALASAPSTSERALRAPLNRRAFTAPIRNIRQNLPVLEADPQGAETLYAHGAGKILSFSTSNSLARTHSSTSDERWELHNETTGTLPWTSLTERTIAAGRHRRSPTTRQIAEFCIQDRSEYTASLAPYRSSIPAISFSRYSQNRNVGVWTAYRSSCCGSDPTVIIE